MDRDTIDWAARWSGIASRKGLTLIADGDGWRLDRVPIEGTETQWPRSISADVERLPDGRVDTRRMTREEVEAFFGPDDGPI